MVLLLWELYSSLETFGPPLVVRQVAVLLPLWVPDVVVIPWRVENFQLVGLTPAFEHRLCAHMVLLVLGCGGYGSVMSPLWLYFPLRIEMESYNCAG